MICEFNTTDRTWKANGSSPLNRILVQAYRVEEKRRILRVISNKRFHYRDNDNPQNLAEIHIKIKAQRLY